MKTWEFVFELDHAERARANAARVGPIQLALPRACACAVLGPSGSGKSTLLALLARAEPVDRGRVLWLGQDVTRASESALALLRRGSIGIVGQSFFLLEHLPVWRGVAIGLAALGVESKEQKRRALAQLEALGIEARSAERLPAQLSGGERQRAALARALLSAGTAIIADEPTSNQDAASAELVVDALLAHVAQGCALVVATHDPRLERAAQQCIRLASPGGAR